MFSSGMPVLSSFLPYRRERKAKTTRPPFTIRRVDSPSSPHPYASPDVLDVRGNMRFNSQERLPAPPLQDDTDGSARLVASSVSESPRVKLNLDLNPESLSDWLPTNFLESVPYTSRAGETTEINSGETRVDNAVGVSRESGNGASESVTEDGEDEEETSSSSEAVLSALQAMDASSFVSPADSAFPLGLPRKPPPAPIRIPNARDSKVQLVRSSDPTQGHTQSRPDSQVSTAESSAVSGTTLARALMFNTFVLSGDIRASRYRSGTSNLTRSDSATLPRGEHSFLHSPQFRERTLSGGEITSTPGTGGIPITPVPPVPMNAGLLYVPPDVTRRSLLDTRERPRTADSKKRSSTGSHHSRSASDPEVSAISLTRSNSDSRDLSINHQALRRISRISEAASSYPPTPDITETRILRNKSTSSKGSSSSPPPGSSHVLSNIRQENISPPISQDSISPTHSSTSEPSSAKDIDNVLDYYSIENTPDASDTHFKPTFSPIREESSSQLSPFSTLSARSKRESRRGRDSYSPLPSTNGRLRSDRKSQINNLGRPQLQPVHNTRGGSSRLPIGERPHSIQMSPGPSAGSPPISPHSSLPYVSPISEDTYGALVPPSRSNIFNRKRSGSAPSPIMVVRDSKDLKAYKITVTPHPGSPASSTPTTGNSDSVSQTFPETPNAFSPIWSPSSAVSPAFTPGGTGIQPSLTQQVLLTRAATSVRGTRNSRQGSMSRARSIAQHPYPGSSSTLPTSQAPATVGSVSTVERSAAETGASDQPRHPQSDLLDSRVGPALPERIHEIAVPSTPDEPAGIPSIRSFSDRSSTSGSGSTSPYSGIASIHSVSPTTPSGPPSRTTSTGHSRQPRPLNDPPQLPKGSPRIPPSPIGPPPSPSQQPVRLSPNIGASNYARNNPSRPGDPVLPRTHTTTHTNNPAAPTALHPATPPVVVTPPPSSQYIAPSPSVSVDRSQYDSGSPPPYDLVVRDSSPTPSTGVPGLDLNYRFGTQASPSTSVPYIQESTSDQRPGVRDLSNNGQRHRTRPPLPAGPRRPSQTHGALPPSVVAGLRPRNPSVSSIGSNPSNGNLRKLQSTSHTPKFQIPPPKWRGYTMDAAKWTFSSAQLQAIVSRAIKQSAQASSIRLVALESLDKDIPGEMHRLEVQRKDIKTKYQMLARRRGSLLELLYSHLEAGPEVDNSLRLVEDLGNISLSLDRLAEDLHSVDEQLASLDSLCQVHWASAHAMALRKLNASFHKQVAESQELRQRVLTMEAERDEAWKQAEEVANDYDRLQEKADNAPLDHPINKRSSRILAVRKSSVRLSKAGLRLSNPRLSQGSSTSSNGQRTSTSRLSSSTRTTFSDEIPPVPPIPRRRPSDIVTNMSLRSSMGFLTSGTSTSETRALVQVQEELYRFLGTAIKEKRVRRSQSVTDRESQQPQHDSAIPTRPSSLPGGSTTEVYRTALDVGLDYL